MEPNALKTQVDRWPLTENEKDPYMLSVVVIAHFSEKPSKLDIIKAVQFDVVKQLRGMIMPLLLFLLFAPVSQAQQVEVNASLIILCPARAYCDNLTEVRTLAQRIGYKNWTIIVEPPQLFTRDAHRNHAYHNTAFSILGANITYINSDAIRGNNLAWILTHERGHYICNCTDERKAQSAADSLKLKVGLA